MNVLQAQKRIGRLESVLQRVMEVKLPRFKKLKDKDKVAEYEGLAEAYTLELAFLKAKYPA